MNAMLCITSWAMKEKPRYMVNMLTAENIGSWIIGKFLSLLVLYHYFFSVFEKRRVKRHVFATYFVYTFQIAEKRSWQRFSSVLNSMSKINCVEAY